MQIVKYLYVLGIIFPLSLQSVSQDINQESVVTENEQSYAPNNEQTHAPNNEQPNAPNNGQIYAPNNEQPPFILPMEEEIDPEQIKEEIQTRLNDYVDELNQLFAANSLQIEISGNAESLDSYTRILDQKIRLLDGDFKAFGFRWDAFLQAEQPNIANDEDLMNLMTQVQMLKQEISDSINAQKQKCQAVGDFSNAENFVMNQDSVYKHLYDEAQKLSLVKNTAPQLEKLKAQEQALFSKIQDSYDKSKAAVQIVPELGSRTKAIDEKYYSLKLLSEKIQAMEYKSFFQRIKDYLLGLACVSIILMFFNMIVTKIKTARKMREAMKQQKEFFNKSNGENIPTI